MREAAALNPDDTIPPPTLRSERLAEIGIGEWVEINLAEEWLDDDSEDDKP